MRICRRVHTAFAIALVLTVLPSVASATGFFCGSGDVFCLVGSIGSSNEGRGADTIILEAGTFLVTVVDNLLDGRNGLPSITGRLTIQGAGADVTILDGGGLVRLLHIAATGRVTLQGLTIQHGQSRGILGSLDAGGAIFNRGHLTLSETVVRDSVTATRTGPVAGGILNLGTLRILDSRVTHNTTSGVGWGAGIASQGTLHILRSTIEDNSAVDVAGGIYAEGLVTIRNSAIVT